MTEPCMFTPPHEPFYCRIHADVRLRLTDERCRRGVTLTQPQPDAGLREALAKRIAVAMDEIGVEGNRDNLAYALEIVDRAALRPTPAAPQPEWRHYIDGVEAFSEDAPQPDAGLREAAKAVVQEGPLGEAPCCCNVCRCSAHERLRAALRSTPAAPQPDAGSLRAFLESIRALGSDERVLSPSMVDKIVDQAAALAAAPRDTVTVERLAEGLTGLFIGSADEDGGIEWWDARSNNLVNLDQHGLAAAILRALGLREAAQAYLDAFDMPLTTDPEVHYDTLTAAREALRAALRSTPAAPLEADRDCGAYHPDHPGTRCRRKPGHAGEHATARYDVTWDNAYLSGPEADHA